MYLDTFHAVQSYVFLKVWKVPDITTALDFLFTEAADPLQKSCSKQLFGKFPGRPASVLKRTPSRMF